MAVSTQTLPINMSDTTTLRAFVVAFEAGLTATGLVQVASTGEINPATVTFAGTNWTIAGYRMWRFNDTAQATFPVFIKVGYGYAMSNSPYYTMVIGFAQDGALNLVGQTYSLAYGGNRGYGSSTTACLWSGDGGRFANATWNCGGSVYENIFSIERDSIAGGLMMWAATYNSTSYTKSVYWAPYSGVPASIVNPVTYGGFYLPNGLTTGAVGNNVYTWGYRAYQPVESPGAGSDILLYFAADLIQGNGYTLSVNGANKTYKAISVYLQSNFNFSRENTQPTGLLMRYE